jgi:hypothetical protein
MSDSRNTYTFELVFIRHHAWHDERARRAGGIEQYVFARIDLAQHHARAVAARRHFADALALFRFHILRIECALLISQIASRARIPMVG